MLKNESAGVQGISVEGYRADIDGLRAVAILAVVAFHAGLPYASGGFVGVDVFFVISGFLITGLLFRECASTGRIDILDFYARRVRRLLPALAVVLTATLVAGYFFLTPIGEQQDLAASALATAAFAANFFFWRTQTGYFAGPAEQLPLLHMWTLAVEEQFYIVWPVVMLFIGALARSRGYSLRVSLVASLLAASVVSLLACIWVTPVKTTFAFYMTPFRGWEFGVGGLLAMLPSRWSGPRATHGLGAVLSLAGLLAILLAVFGFDSNTLFPGYAAALPVFGTGAIILGMSWAPGAPVASFLKTPLMVGIGKLSYSWYLWHWPMLAIVHAVNLGVRTLWLDLVLVGVALAASAVTYRYIEQPVRQRSVWPNASSMATVKTGLIALLSTGALAGLVWGGALYQLHNDKTLQALAIAKSEVFPFPAKCKYFKLQFTGVGPVDDCTLGGTEGSPIFVLWGDSHAFHFTPVLAEYAKTNGARLLPRAMGACKPYIRSVGEGSGPASLGHGQRCISFNKAVRDELSELRARGASHVILAAQWAVPGFWRNGLGRWEEDLSETIKEIRSAGLGVLLFGDIPRHEWIVADCIFGRGEEACSRKRSDVIAEAGQAMSVLQAVAAKFDGVRIWNPLDEMCPVGQDPQGRCLVIRDGVVLYKDGDHLSVGGARTLLPSISKFMQQSLTRSGQ